MAMLSEIEQYILVKGGCSGILGSSTRAINWGYFAMDMLLLKSCNNAMFKRVLCLNFGRNPADFEGGNSGRVTVLNELDVFLHTDTFSDYTAGVIQRLEHEVNQDGSRECIALFVYSFNEVIISAGLRNSMSFLSSLIAWVNLLHAEDSLSPSSLIIQFCATQLRPDTVAQLQDMLTTVAIVIPNVGILAPSVAAEIQLIRRSPATGRVTECLEMFKMQNHQLIPIAIEKTRDQQSAAAVDKLSEAVEGKESSAASTSEKEKAVPPLRLITFDSTDPEFDEDSDPDADLDL